MPPVLRLGTTNEWVTVWTTFLYSAGLSDSIYSGYTTSAKENTKSFQRKYGLIDDGDVGEQSWGMAMALGLRIDADAHVTEFSQVRPPAGLTYIRSDDREKFFGVLRYTDAPTKGNIDGIKITNGWVASNIATVFVPQLKTLAGLAVGCGFPTSGKVQWHANYVEDLLGFFRDVELYNLLGHIMTWGGSWAPRKVRGGTALSNHAYATAFDINVAWNGLGRRPAGRGEKGSVVELVELAAKNRFWWGGWGWPPNNRLDGMHFEIGKHDILR